MKSYIYLSLLLLAFGITACKKNEEPAKALPAGMHAVKVLEHMDASNYTYLHVQENEKNYWMAAPQFKVETGETLYYVQAMEMKNFESKALNKTFESILFVQMISNSLNGPAARVSPHNSITSTKKEDVKIEPLKEGKTIEQIFAQKEKLAGKTVKVKGKVTKFNGGIMGKNWIHIQDGTGSNETADLLITSDETVKVGDVIVAEGTIAINKDFGAGYAYKVLIENGKISKGI
jgi:hypothetical protein